MPIKFNWKPEDNPEISAKRIEIGLELGGTMDPISTSNTSTAKRAQTKRSQKRQVDDILRTLRAYRPTPYYTPISATEGKVQLFEESGIGANRREKRLIATFHGKFHPPHEGNKRKGKKKKKEKKEFTFEIFVHENNKVGDNVGWVHGFDPECILGVDAFVLTFVNREFIIYFPFLLDNRRQKEYLEIRAVAEDNAGKQISPLSPVLNLPIRRKKKKVKTTSNWKYTGNLIGNIILHHEDFILWSSKPQLIIPIIPNAPSQMFEPYKEGSMQIILMNGLLKGLEPSTKPKKNYLRDLPNPLSLEEWQRIFQTKIKETLREIFLDAGFKGIKVFMQNDEGAKESVAVFKQARRKKRNIEAPFWTFYITKNNRMKKKALGLAEGLKAKFTINYGNKNYKSPYEKPIGSGKKEIEQPIMIKTKAIVKDFLPTYDQDFLKVYRKAELLPESSLIDFAKVTDKIVEIYARRVSNLIAHEVGHSLGLMHETIVNNKNQKGPYKERAAKNLLTIMCSSTENERFSLDAKFSNQAKVIWIKAFRVVPKNSGEKYYLNKTWHSNECKNSDCSWANRRQKFRNKYYEYASYLSRWDGTVRSRGKIPYAEPKNNPQRGTYQP